MSTASDGQLRHRAARGARGKQETGGSEASNSVMEQIKWKFRHGGQQCFMRVLDLCVDVEKERFGLIHGAWPGRSVAGTEGEARGVRSEECGGMMGV